MLNSRGIVDLINGSNRQRAQVDNSVSIAMDSRQMTAKYETKKIGGICTIRAIRVKKNNYRADWALRLGCSDTVVGTDAATQTDTNAKCKPNYCSSFLISQRDGAADA